MFRSIRVRMVLAMNLLVVAVGVAVGWVGIAVAGRAIEYRLIDQQAANAAGLAGEMRLPVRSRELMVRIGRILGAEAASSPGEGAMIAASSLPPEQQDELAQFLQDNRQSQPRSVRLGGKAYRIGSAPIRDAAYNQPTGQPMTLYVLVPEADVTAAKQDAAWKIAALTAAAIVVATALAIWLSTTIARPVRVLAQRMDGVGKDSALDTRHSSLARAPREIAALERSFDQLLTRLDDARVQLARSARLAALGQLAASVAHELRNPLSGIKMNARVLADELAGAGHADRSLDLIIREIERMDVYLGQLLNLSPESARLAPRGDAGPVSLVELAESVLASLAERCRQAGIEVVRRFDAPDARVLALGRDGQQLRQVILNLVLNALDAMPGGRSVTVAISKAEGRVRFSVTDTGGGVQVPDGTDIFEPFVTTKAGGTGLGLAICRQIIARHAGLVGYDNSPNGATFWFELNTIPIADA
jgi:signal transduction histidine kinase